MRLALALLASVGPVIGLIAQSPPIVDPPAFRWVANDVDTAFPFGRTDLRTLRYLEIHDGLAGTPRTIQGIAFRRSVTDPHRVRSFTADLSLQLSTAAQPAAAIQSDFAANHGPDQREVIARRWISFPESTGPWPGLAPFDYALPLDAPVAFGGAGPLCFEIRLHDHRSLTAARFALAAAGHGNVATIGTGCLGVAQTATIRAAAHGPEAVHRCTGLPPNAPSLTLFGVDFEAFQSSIPLPLDLTPIGATDCALYLDPLLQLSRTADGFGVVEHIIDVSALPAGTIYGAQVVALDPGRNPLGASFSNAVVLTPMTARVVGRVWNTDVNATSGIAQPVFGLVTGFR